MLLQVIDLAKVRPEDLDPRLAELAGVIERTNAVILNIDYPLGMAAYYIGPAGRRADPEPARRLRAREGGHAERCCSAT